MKRPPLLRLPARMLRRITRRQHGPLWLLLATLLLLSGCALVPFAQAAGVVVIAIATLLGLAACAADSGNGGGTRAMRRKVPNSLLGLARYRSINSPQKPGLSCKEPTATTSLDSPSPPVRT